MLFHDCTKFWPECSIVETQSSCWFVYPFAKLVLLLPGTSSHINSGQLNNLKIKFLNGKCFRQFNLLRLLFQFLFECISTQIQYERPPQICHCPMAPISYSLQGTLKSLICSVTSYKSYKFCIAVQLFGALSL